MTVTRNRVPLLTGLPVRLAMVSLMLVSACLAWPSDLQAQLPVVTPEAAGMSSSRLAGMGPLVEAAIAAGEMPGCVVCVGRSGKICFLQAWGDRQVLPQPIPMSVDTVFDLASLTKPVATATAIMQLVEDGQLRLGDRIPVWMPEFAANGKQDLQILDLLLHRSGLIADNPLADYEQGPAEAWQRICQLGLVHPVGERFVYSDVNFIVLGELVHRVSGRPLDLHLEERLFRPLGMQNTAFRPTEGMRARMAPTGQRNGAWLCGEVHDPRAHALGGVAGHAGLFSCATDLASYADLLLRSVRGEYPSGPGSRPPLAPATVAAMTRSRLVGDAVRGLGWDKRSAYSSNRGDLLGPSAFGHGGFTGTVLWIDPDLDLFFVFLSNRLHPDEQGNINPLSGKLLNLAAAAIERTAPPESPVRLPVLSGIDVLEREQFRSLAGQRIGLVTNQTGRNLEGTATAELLHRAAAVDLRLLFSPEHGLAGQRDDDQIGDGTDPATGLPVYSLYGETRRPGPEVLEQVDTLVVDLQDIGTRFYTYLSTLGEVMLAAEAAGKRVVVLDRPNPVNGVEVSGPMLDAGAESFTGWHPLPVRHGMTIGELARLICAERKLKLDLQVIACEGWTREMGWEATGQSWVDPSPNMRNLNAALLYPGVGLLETTNLSVGRGTDTPFERVGAPWIRSREWAQRLNGCGLQGVAFVPIRFVPASSRMAGETCHGVQILITRRDILDPVAVGLALASTLRELHPGQWELAGYQRLLGNAALMEALTRGDGLEALLEQSREGVRGFRLRRHPFLLYE